MAKLIKADGTVLDVFPKNGKAFKLEEMQGMVGGYIEFVHLDGDVMCLNEEGKLEGLTPNVNATSIARPFLFEGDFIAGDAVVMSKKEAGE